MYDSIGYLAMKLSKTEVGKIGYQSAIAAMDDCRARLKEKARLKYEQENAKCLQCGKRIPYESRRNRFCSRSCSCAHGNSRSKQKHEATFCICGARTYGQEHCSWKCFSDDRYKSFINAWKSGGVAHPKHSVSPHIRRYLIEKKGEACWECGWNKIHSVTGRVPLEVEHIDGDSTNNSEDNLKMLCPNCHSLTSTYRNLNRGKSKRSWRRRGVSATE